MANNALFLFDSRPALLEAMRVGGYSPRFRVGQDGTVRWRSGHRKAAADLACLQPGGWAYLFTDRGIYGRGVLADPAVVLNHEEALVSDPGVRDGVLEGTTLPEHRLVVRFDRERSTWFREPVDMDDVLAAGADRMYSLRTMEGVSFAVFDEAEALAFEQELWLRNAGEEPTAQEAELAASLPLAIPDLNVACDGSDELAMESDLAWRLNRGENLDAFDGSWYAAIRQFSASPPKPVSYVDRIDILARRMEPAADPRFIAEHGVCELKTGKATKKDAEQLMRYVDWVVDEFHHGRYDRVRAYLVAQEFGARLVPDLPDVSRRLYTTDPRRPRAQQWAAVKLITAERNPETGGYRYETFHDLAESLE